VLIYGNPPYETVQQIKNSILIREWNRLGVFEPLKNVPYPDAAETRKELEYLVSVGKTVDSTRLVYIKLVDDTLYTVMSEYLGSFGVTASPEEVEAKLEPYDPIISYLKVLYNRPRPFQTAGVYGVPLYPLLKSKTAGDSSYPGGHTLLALFFTHIYGEMHPELATPLMRFVWDVAKTREEGGVHYPSDNQFSFYIYKHLKPWMTAQTKVYSILDK
jgi:hypothetical protein